MPSARAAMSLGKVLLDGDGPGKRDLVGEIRHAETASSQHTLDAVVADQLCPAWQCDEIRHGSPRRSRTAG